MADPCGSSLQTHLCAATNYTHFTDKAFRYALVSIPLSMLDFGLAVVPFALAAVRELLEYYIHSPTSAHLGPLRRVFVDNRFHRIHHSLEPRHFDKTFAILFSFWDRMFGTAYEPGKEWPAVGIAHAAPPRTLTEYLLFPLRLGRVDRLAAFVSGVRRFKERAAPWAR